MANPYLLETGTDQLLLESGSILLLETVFQLAAQTDIGSSTGIIRGSGGGNEAAGQSFTVATASRIDHIDLYFLASTGAPTDNVIVDLVDAIASVSPIETWTIAATSVAPGWRTFTSVATPTLAASSTYYLRVTRSGARDISNYVQFAFNAAASYANGKYQQEGSGVWSEPFANGDAAFGVYGSPASLVVPSRTQRNFLLRT